MKEHLRSVYVTFRGANVTSKNNVAYNVTANSNRFSLQTPITSPALIPALCLKHSASRIDCSFNSFAVYCRPVKPSI